MLRAFSLVFFFTSSFSYATALQGLEKQLLENNPSLQSFKLLHEAKESESSAATGKFLPEVYLTGGYTDFKTLHEPEQGYVGYITGAWNLFQGGADYYHKNIASQEAEIAGLNLEIERRSLIYKVRSLYYQTLASKKILNLYADKLVLLQSQRQMAQKKVNAGLTSGVDAIEIDIEENTLRTQKELLETEISQNLADLKALLNADVGNDQVPTSDNFPQGLVSVTSEKAIDGNPEFKKQILHESISQSERSIQRSELIPRLDLEASYGRLTGVYDDPWSGSESKVALLLRWNIFSGFSNYNNLKSSKARAQASTQEKASVALTVKAQLDNLLAKQKELSTLRNLTQQRLGLTKKYYEMTLAEYKRGVKNSSDLDGATTSYYENQRRLIEVERDITLVVEKIKELI